MPFFGAGLDMKDEIFSSCSSAAEDSLVLAGSTSALISDHGESHRTLPPALPQAPL